MGQVIRYLTLALNYRDAGVATGLRRTDQRVAGTKRQFTSLTREVNASQLSIVTLGFMASRVFGNMIKEAATVRKELTLASFATRGNVSAVEELDEANKKLVRDFRTMPSEVASLQKAVARLGITSRRFADHDADRLIDRMTRASLGFSKIYDTDAPELAKSIFRIGLLTTRSNKEFGDLIDNSAGVASAIGVLGDSVSAGAEDLAEFLERFNAVATAIKLDTPELIGLAAAFTNINPSERQRVTTSVLRLFGKGLPENQMAVSQFMGLDTDEFNRMRVNKPIEFLILLSTKLREFRDQQEAAGDATEALTDKLIQLGIVNQRDVRTTTALIASLELIPDLISDARIEMDSGEAVADRMNATFDTLSGTIDLIRSRFGLAGKSVVDILTPAMQSLGSVLAGIADLISRSRGLQALLGVGGGIAAARIGGAFFSSFIGPALGIGRGRRGRGGSGAMFPLAMGAEVALARRGMRRTMPAAVANLDPSLRGGGAAGRVRGRLAGQAAVIESGLGRTLTQAELRQVSQQALHQTALGRASRGRRAFGSAAEVAAFGALTAGPGLRSRLRGGRIGTSLAGLRDNVRVGRGAVAAGSRGGFLARFGGGALGAFGMRGAGFASRLAGRGMLGRIALGAAGTGGVGAIAAAIPLIGRLAGIIGNLVESVSEGNGVLSAVGKIFALIFKLFEAGGAIVEKAFDLIGGAIKKIANIPGFSKLNDMLQGAIDGVDSFTESLRDNKDAADDAAGGGSGSGTGGDVTFNYNFNTRQDALRRTAEEVFKPASFGIGSGKVIIV